MKSMEKGAPVNIAIIIGIVAAITFTGISLYILFLFPHPLLQGNNDLRFYAMLTGAYGLWRAVRVFLLWKKTQQPHQPFTVLPFHKEAP